VDFSFEKAANARNDLALDGFLLRRSPGRPAASPFRARESAVRIRTAQPWALSPQFWDRSAPGWRRRL